VTTPIRACPLPISGLCSISLTRHGLTASGSPADGGSTRWLGVRPGSTAASIFAVDVTRMAFGHLLQALGRHSYVVEADWRPSRVALVAGGRQVDLHPLLFDAQATGWQANVEGQEPFQYPQDAFAKGLIDGRLVDCLSVTQQLRFHHGYLPRERDNHDIALLEALIGRAGAT
jgi:hypothetical protein